MEMLKVRDVLVVLKKKGKISRNQVAKELKVSKQRTYGFIDAMEDSGLVVLDRTVRPYQVENSDLGNDLLNISSKHDLPGILKEGVDNLSGEKNERK